MLTYVVCFFLLYLEIHNSPGKNNTSSGEKTRKRNEQRYGPHIGWPSKMRDFFLYNGVVDAASEVLESDVIAIRLKKDKKQKNAPGRANRELCQKQVAIVLSCFGWIKVEAPPWRKSLHGQQHTKKGFPEIRNTTEICCQVLTKKMPWHRKLAMTKSHCMPQYLEGK